MFFDVSIYTAEVEIPLKAPKASGVGLEQHLSLSVGRFECFSCFHLPKKMSLNTAHCPEFSSMNTSFLSYGCMALLLVRV